MFFYEHTLLNGEMKKFRELVKGDPIWVVDFHYERDKWFSYEGNITVVMKTVENKMYRRDVKENLRLDIRNHLHPLYFSDIYTHKIIVLKHTYSGDFESAIYFQSYDPKVGPPILYFSDEEVMKEVIKTFIKDVDIIYKEKISESRKTHLKCLKSLKNKLKSL